jgi:hypothetical protein
LAEIWLWRDGDHPTTGGPLAELPLADCVIKLGVSPHHYYGDLSTPPRLQTEYPRTKSVRVVMGSPNVRGYQHVVMRLNEAEAQADEWKPGFYLCPVSPAAAYALFEE